HHGRPQVFAPALSRRCQGARRSDADRSGALSRKNAMMLRFLVAANTAIGGGPVPWVFDAPHSRIGFISRHMGLTFVHGYFRKADVQVNLDEADPTKSSIEATIDAASLTSDFERRDDAVKGENYLDVESFPTI